MTRWQKTRSIQVVVIPAAAAGTLWDIPTKKAMANLRVEVMNATWGRGRKMRCAEMVMAIISAPTKIDPLAAIVYKRLSNARRHMNTKKETPAGHTHLRVDEAKGRPKADQQPCDEKQSDAQNLRAGGPFYVRDTKRRRIGDRVGWDQCYGPDRGLSRSGRDGGRNNSRRIL